MEGFGAVKFYIVLASTFHINTSESLGSKKPARTIKSSLFTQQRIAQLMEATLLPRELCSLIAMYDELRLWKQTLAPQLLADTMRTITLGHNAIYSYTNAAGPGIVIWNVVRDTIKRCAISDKKPVQELLPISRKIFATRSEGGVYTLWNVNAGKHINTFSAPHGGACCQISNKYFALEEWDNPVGADSIIVRNVQTGKPCKRRHLGEVNCMKKISQRRLATGSTDGRITVWKISGIDIAESQHVLFGADSDAWSTKILCLETLSQHTFASGCMDGSLKIWNRHNGLCLWSMQLAGPIFSLIRLRKSVVAANMIHRVEVWDIEQRTELHHISSPEEDLRCRPWSKNGFMYIDEGFAFWEYAWEHAKKKRVGAGNLSLF